MKKIKTMTPYDCAKYCDVRPQLIREMLKAKKVDFGTAIFLNKRWSYVVIPSKFFNWLGQELPEEFR